MKINRFLAIISLSVLLFANVPANAQCAMCTLTAENSVKNGNTDGRGLNRGILFLLAAPYLAVAGIGFLWYKKYKKKNVDLRIKDEKISLN